MQRNQLINGFQLVKIWVTSSKSLTPSDRSFDPN